MSKGMRERESDDKERESVGTKGKDKRKVEKDGR